MEKNQRNENVLENEDCVQFENKVKTKFEAYSGKEPYLFVSYSHRDDAVVYPILDQLYDKRYRIWYDESCENGGDFRDELRIRIEHSDGVLLFVSQNSMNSTYCSMEVILAEKYGKRIFPVKLDEYPYPPAFELLLSHKHHGNVSEPEKLIKSLVRDLPAITMNRLTIVDGYLKKCEDNGDTIDIDEGVHTICAESFKGRTKLHTIKLPSTLENIGCESFRGCSALKEMIIPKNVQRIEESAFRDCISLKKLVIENKNIRIGERAFENCANLTEIVLPEGMTEIYGGVFNSCKSLRNIKLPDDLTVLGESAFSDCILLDNVNVPGMVSKIDDLVFNGCTELSKIELHNGLKKIGKSAFKNCHALTSIFIPASVTIINSPFRGCISLKTIQVDSKNKYFKSEPNRRGGVDHVLFNKNKSSIIAYPANSHERAYDIPDSVMTINDWTFCECRNLNRVTIPDSVHEIGEGAFYNCSQIDAIEIPDSVVRIDDCAFRGCTNLKSIIVPDSVKELGWGILDGCEKTVTVYCDEGSLIYEYCEKNAICHKHISEKESN